MTMQEMFNAIWEHAKKGEKSSNSAGNCYYRLDGTPECPYRCFVGVLIPDDLYSKKMENNTAFGLLTRFPELANYLGLTIDNHPEYRRNAQFLIDCQGIHDDNLTSMWLSKLSLLAHDFELTIPS